jgi:hypothetical protein
MVDGRRAQTSLAAGERSREIVTLGVDGAGKEVKRRSCGLRVREGRILKESTTTGYLEEGLGLWEPGEPRKPRRANNQASSRDLGVLKCLTDQPEPRPKALDEVRKAEVLSPMGYSVLYARFGEGRSTIVLFCTDYSTMFNEQTTTGRCHFLNSSPICYIV